MKKTVPVLLTLCFLTPLLVFAQDPSPEYAKLVEEAFAQYKAKEYKKSAFTYAAAIKANGGKGYMDDRYNAACSWALAGYPDSAFFNLNRIVTIAKYANYNHVTTDKDLISLHADARWQPLLAIVRQNRDKEEEKYNKQLTRQLDSIYVADQTDRVAMNAVEKQYGFDSDQMKILLKSMNQKDSVNLVKVKAILDKHGWLGPDSVGQQGNTTLFLVIQHADLATQMHYLPMMQEAVKNGRAEGSQLALLVDRVEMGNGRPQVYGSQITMKDGKYIVYKILDEANVNKRRAEVGLNPLEEYVKHWNIDYKPLAK